MGRAVTQEMIPLRGQMHNGAVGQAEQRGQFTRGQAGSAEGSAKDNSAKEAGGS